MASAVETSGSAITSTDEDVALSPTPTDVIAEIRNATVSPAVALS